MHFELQPRLPNASVSAMYFSPKLFPKRLMIISFLFIYVKNYKKSYKNFNFYFEIFNFQIGIFDDGV